MIIRDHKKKNTGFTLVEVLVTVSIFVMVIGIITLAQRNIFSFNGFIQADLNAQIEGRRAVTQMVSEMREMAPSSLGSYPIAAAATSSITFYSDIDSDAVREQVKYYISGTQVMKSVINPTGNPLTYSPGSAIITTVASSILNGTSTPLFEYYDTNYAGTPPALSSPINVSAVKLVKITMILEDRSSRGTAPLTITSQVTLRNLKDNY